MKQEKPLWQPSAKQIKEAQITQFTQQVEHKFQQSFVDYKALHTWSIQHKEDFWASVWDFCQIQSSQSFDAVLLESFDMQKAQWFPGAKLNFAQNLLRFRDDNTAIISIDEQGERQRLSFQQLYVAVSRLTSALLDAGIKPGDCIVGYLPNITETVIAMLATTSIGAIWSACSPDFGVDAAVDRFAQIKPKLLFATDQQQYRGKQHILIEKVKAVCQKVTSIQHVVIIPYQPDKPVKSPPAWISYKNFIHEPSPIPFAQLPFSHPIYILYSSGTTGIPKCLVHSAGGTLIQHLKELILHTDLHRNDTIFYFTTCSWMMWHWLVSSLAVGATMVLYDGAPDYPQTGSLINLIDNTNISVFGTNAKYLSLLEKAHIYPKDTHQLKTLRTILATGSPLLPAQYDYVYSQWKNDVKLCSISGGTDIISCFALGNPTLPIYRGELQCCGLGMDVDVFDEQGNSLVDTKGELVCKSPFPSMPIYFWNDLEGEKYAAAYFSQYKNTWAHGDYAKITIHNGLIIYGRSDTTLNPGGIRIGSAEIYRQVEKIDDILESVVVSQRWQGDTRIILFVKLQPNQTINDKLRAQINHNIKTHLSPRHLPSKIIQINNIPKTVNGKIVELAIQQVIHGETITNLHSLANPEALDEYQDIPELHTS